LLSGKRKSRPGPNSKEKGKGSQEAMHSLEKKERGDASRQLVRKKGIFWRRGWRLGGRGPKRRKGLEWSTTQKKKRGQSSGSFGKKKKKKIRSCMRLAVREKRAHFAEKRGVLRSFQRPGPHRVRKKGGIKDFVLTTRGKIC